MNMVETYDLNDPKSWRKMHRPEPGQEISAASYRALLQRALAENGWIRNDDFLALVEQIFGPIFGPEDTALVMGRPKWMNTVDWAKAQMTKSKVIKTRSRVREGVKETFIVSIEHVHLVRWILGAKPKYGFKKKCPRCKKKRPLREEVCGERAAGVCGFKFPRLNQRVHRLPK